MTVLISTQEIHSMLVACYGLVHWMTLLVILMKYTRCTSHIIGLVHINDMVVIKYVISAWNDIVINTCKIHQITSHIIELMFRKISVLSTWTYAVCSQFVMIDTWQLYRKHFARFRYCYMMVKYKMDDLHVTVNTWWL